MRSVLLVLTVGSVGVLSGCSSILGTSVNHNVSFDGGGSRTFIFNKSGDITPSSIKKSLASSFENASDIHKIRYSYSDSGNRYTKGVEASVSDNSIIVKHYDNFSSLYDEKSAVYDVSITENKNNYKVIVQCPSVYHDRAKFRGGIGKEYIPGDIAAKNFNVICNEAKPVIDSSLWVEGEFNSKYKSEDVFSNYSRLLSKVKNRKEVKGYDIEKAEVFKFNMSEDSETNLALTVYPYRGGSKVVYAFLYNFKTDSDGNTTYSEVALKKAKEHIVKIAND